jgi:branched-chain amino acid transport system substrate-binding protein
MIGFEWPKRARSWIRTRFTRWRFIGAASTLALSVSACDVLLEFGADQCQKTEDCRAKGSKFADTLCIQGVCTVPGASTSTGAGPDGGDGADSCVTTQQCVDQKGGYYRCRNSKCMPLLSEDCKQLLGDDAYLDDNAIIFGLISELTGAMDFTGKESVRAVQLALDEIDKFGNGLPGGPNGTQRPVAYVVCDETVDHLRAARHLVEDVGVPAIIGPDSDSRLLDIATKVTNIADPGVLMLTTVGVSPTLLTLQDNSLVWQLNDNAGSHMSPTALSVLDVQKNIRDNAIIPATQDIKVAISVRGDVVGKSAADLLQNILVFNGKTALEQASSPTPTFSRIDYADPADTQVDYTSIVQKLISFKPNIIVSMGGYEISTQIMKGLESAWPTGTPRPFYVQPGPGEPGLWILFKNNQDVRARVRGTYELPDPGTDALRQAFELRHQAFHGQPPGPGAHYVYDAVYQLAYASVIAGKVPTLTGAELAKAFPKLNPPGEIVNVQPGDLTTGPQGLLKVFTGVDIDLNGTSSKLDFDSETGSINANLAIWCLKNTWDGMQTAGQTYDKTTKSLVGAYSCP